MSLSGKGRLPLTRTLAELEELFKKYEKAYNKIDHEAYAKYKKDVDVKGNWAIETKIHNYNYTKRRIEHYKKHGTDLLETKKNIIYYSKDKKKVEGTKYEGTTSQKPFLTKKVIEDEKVKKKRVKKVLTDEEKIQAKEARRVKKLDKKELQYLEGKAQLGEKLTTNEKQRLKALQENFVELSEEKKQQLIKKKEEARVKKIDAKYEKMKAYISENVKRIKKEETQEQTQEEPEEEEYEEQRPQPSLEDILGFKAEEVKPVKLLEVPKVVKRIKKVEELKRLFNKLKDYDEAVKLHEARIKFIDKTRLKLAKQKGNKNIIEEIDKERDLHTKLLNNAVTVQENMRNTIHAEDLKLYRRYIKNPDYFEEEPKPKAKTKEKPSEASKSYVEEIAEPTNPIYLVKPAEKIPEYVQPEESYLDEEEEEEEDEEGTSIFDTNAYLNFIEKTPFRHDIIFRQLENDYSYEDVKKAFIYLNIPVEADIFYRFRRKYDRDYEIRMGQVRSNVFDFKSKENKKFIKQVNEEVGLMLKVLYLLKNPNLI